jgi:hypothetical protein
MDIYAAFATNELAENEGQWFPIGKDASLLVARSGNPAYTAAFRRAMERNKMDLEGSGPDQDALAEDMMVGIMSSTILLGWKGLSFKGKAVDYSVEMAKTLLRVKDFRKKVVGFSDSFEAFRQKSEEEQGNV